MNGPNQSVCDVDVLKTQNGTKPLQIVYTWSSWSGFCQKGHPCCSFLSICL